MFEFNVHNIGIPTTLEYPTHMNSRQIKLFVYQVLSNLPPSNRYVLPFVSFYVLFYGIVSVTAIDIGGGCKF